MAVIGNIQLASLQQSLDWKDRDLKIFVRYRISKDDNGNRYTTNDLVTYRFTHHHFGLTCSPLLLFATLSELAAMCREEYPNAAL